MTNGEWRTDTISPRVRVTHFVPTGYATSVEPGEAWAMAWVHPNPQQYIVEHVMASTRSETWDKVLHIWYDHTSHERPPSGDNVYDPGRYYHDGREYPRHSAISRLRAKGIRVIRVRVVPL